MTLPHQIQALLQQHLPTAPKMIEQLISIKLNPCTTTDDLVNAIESDSELASQIEAWAASPYYSQDGAINCVDDAITRVLGFDMAFHTALGIAIKNAIGHNKVKLTEEHRQYWQDAVLAATVSECLLCYIPHKLRPPFGSTYLTGLLHTCHGLMSDEWIEQTFNTNKLEPHDIVLPLLRFWRIPEATIIALSKHGDPSYKGPYWVDALALYVTKKGLGILRNGDNHLPPIDDKYFQRLNITRDQIEEAIKLLGDSLNLITAIADYTFTYLPIQFSND